MRYSILTEGRTRLLVPTISLQTPEPPTTPVFFNPAASVNRDVSVGITAATNGRTFCDSLAGVGARGVRIAREVRRSMQVTLVDFNPPSVRLARRNVELNSLEERCKVVSSETNAFLYSRFGRDQRFDYVDVDPFGTPAPYIQGAFEATTDGGIVSVTATDTAVLCGVYPGVARRRYGSAPLNNHFKHETGLRILANACRRVAASLDIGIEPVAAHSTRHYMRVFARVKVGATKADAALKEEGYLAWCSRCNHTRAAEARADACEKCGAKVRVAGPLWIGSMVDDAVSARAARRCDSAGLEGAARALRSLVGVGGLPPFSYSLEDICSALGIPSVSERRVAESLESRGYSWMKQPFEKTGLKSNASYEDVVDAVRESAPGTASQHTTARRSNGDRGRPASLRSNSRAPSSHSGSPGA